MQQFTISKPDDWHVHLRQSPLLEKVLPYTARHFGRCTVMPNLKPPIRTVMEARVYREEIYNLAYDLGFKNFTPYMTLYLTDDTTLEELKKIPEESWIIGVKVYPAGATTNSSQGVTTFSPELNLTDDLKKKLDYLQENRIPLLLHGEIADQQVDIFSREAAFVSRVLLPLVDHYPALKIVLEHVSTPYAATVVEELSNQHPVAATVTPHHLKFSRNDLFLPGLQAPLFCRPILQNEDSRQELVQIVTQGDPCFFAGTDSAPHPDPSKFRSPGAAGAFSAPCALGTYTEVFEEADRLNCLEGFLCFHGANFFGLGRNVGWVTLEKKEPEDPSINRQIVWEDCSVTPILYPQWKVIYEHNQSP